MTLNCWIVDDEPLAISLLESYVKKVPYLNLTGKYSNVLSAMQNIASERVDLIFLDIQMPEVNGMQFAHTLPEHTKIIFTTAFSQYAIEGYKVSAIDYLLKPFSFEEFLVASNKALQWFEMTTQNDNQQTKKEDKSIFIKSEYKYINVLFDDILYVEGLKDYVKIYTTSDSKPIISLMTLKQLENDLPTNKFMRVHRSFIINLSEITSFNRNRVQIGQKQIPIGETYRKNFLSTINI
ncbi:MAG: LytR/AlgR family response regulator transcription factor [Fermentimonas sp.]|jgi:two-component system LytT family response regulator